MAGGIEIFSLVDFNFHYGKSSFAIVTGARMIKHLGNIIKDYNRMELATMIMKKIDNAAEHSDNSEYFKIMDQSFINTTDLDDSITKLEESINSNVNCSREHTPSTSEKENAVRPAFRPGVLLLF